MTGVQTCALPICDRLDRRWRAALRSVLRDGMQAGEFAIDDADQAMFVLAALLDGMAPLLVLKAKGVTRDRVERAWLDQAAVLLGSGFDSSPLPRKG